MAVLQNAENGDAAPAAASDTVSGELISSLESEWPILSHPHPHSHFADKRSTITASPSDVLSSVCSIDNHLNVHGDQLHGGNPRLELIDKPVKVIEEEDIIRDALITQSVLRVESWLHQTFPLSRDSHTHHLMNASSAKDSGRNLIDSQSMERQLQTIRRILKCLLGYKRVNLVQADKVGYRNYMYLKRDIYRQVHQDMVEDELEDDDLATLNEGTVVLDENTESIMNNPDLDSVLPPFWRRSLQPNSSSVATSSLIMIAAVGNSVCDSSEFSWVL